MGYEYRFDRDNCWYIGECSKQDTKECYAGCIRYMEMDYLMQTSNIPKHRQRPNSLVPSKLDMDNFIFLRQVKDDIVDFVKSGESLYIYSEAFGNGKTSWAIKMIQKYFDSIWAGNGFRCRALFIHVPSFLTKTKEVISRKDEDFEDIRNRIQDVDLVVWDDIGATKLSDFDHSVILSYLDTRVLKKLSNIYTGNLHEKTLLDALGNRLYSRVWNMSSRVALVGEDRRIGE